MSTQLVREPFRVALNPTLQETKCHHEYSLSEMQGRIGRLLEPEKKWDEPSKLCFVRSPHIGEYTELHASFLYCLSNAYSLHRSVSFGPHDLWYVMLTEIATEVNGNSNAYRNLFTKSPEKVDILVQTSTPEELPLDLIVSELRRLVPVDLSLFLPEFSTHTTGSRIACMAAFADTVKSFYNYMTFACGIAHLEVRGTQDDWGLFIEQVRGIRKAFGASLTDWFIRIENRAQQILNSLQGGDTEFYKDIFSTKRIGSGGELLVNGWFGTDFYRFPGDLPKIDNYPNSWSTVPFTNVDTGRKFTDVHGCFYSDVRADGYRVPQYGRFVAEHLG